MKNSILQKLSASWILTTIFPLMANGQNVVQSTTASESMTISDVAPFVPFNIASTGREMPVRWGIDTAWMWDWWPLRATNHMRECVSLGRVTIDPRVSGSYTSLSSDQISHFDTQLSWLAKSGVTDLFLLAGNASGSAWSTDYRNTFVTDIALGVEYLQSKGYNVIAISHFNEPDYGANNAPDAAEMATVARLMRANATLSNIPVCGPSCLNPDYANAWWDTMKGSLQMGNTHQLAGTFDNFAGFYQKVAESGLPSAGDEMHNINDAIIGMNYGMTYGIWWSDYGGYTRAELGNATGDGRMIGYKENRSLWTSAAVFRRNSQQLVEAFLGTSERQAGESSFTFVSEDRLAYFDGHGPFYSYTKHTPGGTGYTNGQTNSEYVIEVTYGEDVPVGPIEGDFKIVNKATGKVLTNNNGIRQQNDDGNANKQWTVTPVAERASADFSYVNIVSKGATDNTYYLDAQKWAASNGANVLTYPGGGNECERWHLRYMNDGYYVITNHDSGLSLEGSSNNSSSNTTGVVQWERTGTDRQLWRFIPADADVEFTPPAAPTGLTATSLSGSVRLTWNANSENDLLGYMVYRYNTLAAQWETIARRVTGTSFIDNTCPKGSALRYRIRAVDKSWNVGSPSAETTAQTADSHALIAHLPFNGSLSDLTENEMDAIATNSAYDNDNTHPGVLFDGTDDYIVLPYHAGDSHNLTFAAWVKGGSTSAWQRVFDFGNSTDNYLFITAPNGANIRYEICKNGVKQGLNSNRTFNTGEWYHIAVTIGDHEVKLYVNGTEDASTTDITYHPDEIMAGVSYLGRSQFDTDALFTGTLSDVRLYNYALTADEVSDISQAYQYLPLEQQLTRARTLADNHPQDSNSARTAFENAYHETLTAYRNGEYTVEEAQEKALEVNAFTNQYVLADTQGQSGQSFDVSYLLSNADFTGTASDGWELDPEGTTYHDCYEVWNSNFNISQTLRGMPAGTYTLTTQAFYRSGYNDDLQNPPLALNAKIYINDEVSDIMSIVTGASAAEGRSGTWANYKDDTQTPDDMEAAAYAFNSLGSYLPDESHNTVSIVVTDNDETLVLGAKKEQLIAGDWSIFNRFSLYYTPAETALPGDVNGDNNVDVNDVIVLNNYISGEATDIVKRNSDLNDDKLINVSDVIILINFITGNQSGNGGNGQEQVFIPKGDDEEGPGVAESKRRLFSKP